MPDSSVAVIIPAFNAERYLAEAIESVLAQTHPAEEVIVVDDGSTDRTASVATQFVAVTLLQIVHQGVSVARNTGAEASHSALLAFLDADDTWDPRKLELQLQALDSNPGLEMVMCRHRYAFEGPIPGWFHGPRDGSIGPGYLLTGGLIRRTAWERVGPFDPRMTHGEDGDWLMRALDLNVRLTILEEPLFTYRIHGGNASGSADAVRAGVLHALRNSLQRKHGSLEQ